MTANWTAERRNFPFGMNIVKLLQQLSISKNTHITLMTKNRQIMLGRTITPQIQTFLKYIPNI
jgi:hypothetical protein